MRLLGCCLLLLGCTKAAPSPTLSTEPIDFTLPSYPSKQPFSLASERGHVVMRLAEVELHLQALLQEP